MKTGLVRMTPVIDVKCVLWTRRLQQGIVFAVLALFGPTAALDAAQPHVATPVGQPVSLRISSIGTVAIGERKGRAASPTRERLPQPPGANSAEDQGRVVYFVEFREPVELKIGGGLPLNAVPYVLVRKENDKHWNVQPRAIQGSSTGTFRTEVEFGESDDLGQRFEVQAILAQGQLPRGELPNSTLNRTILSTSRTVWVQRRYASPIIAITRVGDTDLYGTVLPPVKLQTPVEIRVEGALPPAHAIGLAVQPAEPAWTDRRWVMIDVLTRASGPIVGHFGMEAMHDQHKFVLTAFVAPLDHFPPQGQSTGIPAADWREYSRWFLAETPPVQVIRWEGGFKILSIGRVAIPDDFRSTVQCAKRCEIRGAVPGPLKPSERVWLLAYPNQGDPWVAGWTAHLDEGGRWYLGLADLSPGASFASFEVLAVISTDDPAGHPAMRLISWLQDQKQRTSPVTVMIGKNLAGTTRQGGPGK